MEFDYTLYISYTLMFIVGFALGKYKVFNRKFYSEIAKNEHEIHLAKLKFQAEMRQARRKEKQEIKAYLDNLSDKSSGTQKGISSAVADEPWLLLPLFFIGGLSSITDALSADEKETLEDLLAKCDIDLPEDQEGDHA